MQGCITNITVFCLYVSSQKASRHSRGWSCPPLLTEPSGIPEGIPEALLENLSLIAETRSHSFHCVIVCKQNTHHELSFLLNYILIS